MKSIYVKLNDLQKKNSEDTVPEMISILKSDEVQRDIQNFINNGVKSQEDEGPLFIIVNSAQSIYNYTGEETGISDSEYDILYELLITNFEEHIKDITTPIITKNKIGYHKFPSLRGTLDKIYFLDDDESAANKSRRGLPDWINSAERKIQDRTGNVIYLNNEDVYVFPKFDGLSCVFEFDKHGNLERALTRGFTETNEGQNITHIFKDWVKGPFTDYDAPYGVKTEIMMGNKDFEDYNKKYHTDYKNSRSIVASILNSDDVDDRRFLLQIMSLRTSKLENGRETIQQLTPGAFNVPYIKCKLSDTDQIREFAEMHHHVGYDNPLRCDGAVIYIINPEIQKILGREDNKQKFEVAYKFTEETGYSKVEDIIFSTGLFGTLNPIAVIKPIKLKGNTITKISLGSIGRFKDLGLAPGDKVKVLYDIIPYLIMDESDPNCKRSGNKPFKVPKSCPDCGDKLELSETGDRLVCTNKKCPCRIKGKILNYFNKMHIDGISYATIDDWYEAGYLKSIKDIYKLNKHRKELHDIPGYGKKSINVKLTEIDSHRHVPYSQMLGSIGIENVSTKMFEKVLSMFKFDELFELALDGNVNAFTVIPGVKDKTAEKIVNGIKENEKLILFLEEELNLIEDSDLKANLFNVAFTKIRDEELEKFIKEHGGKVQDSVTKDTDILVIPTVGVTSSKTEKAKRYGATILPIDEVREYITNNF